MAELNIFSNRSRFVLLKIMIIGVLSWFTLFQSFAQSPDRPNILWITCEDISPNLGAFGDPYARTPHLDQLAQEGVVYTHAFASAPVCAVARSSIITGMHAASQGTQHMRCEGRLPQGIKTYPEYLREAGYYATNNRKTDYNFSFDPKSVWDESSNQAHWRKGPSGKPFFSIFNFHSSHESRVNVQATHEQAIQNLKHSLLRNPGEVPLPPYYPNTPAVQELWARYYNNITAMDQQVGEILQQLKEDGLEEHTIIIFYSDHGAGIPRHKRWLYDSGIQVPLIVKVPPAYQHLSPHPMGSKTDELISFVDLPPTALALAGIEIPANMQGRAFLGANLSPVRNYVYAGRDRMDERYDMQRAVRDKRFKYICYYEAYQPYCQYMNTPEKGAIMQAIRQAAADGSLPQAGWHIVADVKPREELFDTQADPWELRNLAEDPAYEQVLKRMRQAHADWSDRIKDTGLIPETILRHWEQSKDASIYDIMRRDQVPVEQIRETAVSELNSQELELRLAHPNAAVRYWAAISLGNLQAGSKGLLSKSLKDEMPVVRLAAARALAKQGKFKAAMPVLKRELQHEDSWVRLVAAQVLDELGEEARPALQDLQGVMQDNNKYVVRVANHTLNLLKGTQRVVP